MTATVHALGTLSPERLKELEAQGVHVEEPVTDWSTFDLPEPQYGETIVGPLTEEEGQLFATYYKLAHELEDATRSAVGDMLTRVGAQIKTSDRNKSLQDAVQGNDLQFGDEQQEKAYCRLQQRQAYIHAMLFYMIGERTDCHEYRLGIRSKGRVVKMQKRLTAGVGFQS